MDLAKWRSLSRARALEKSGETDAAIQQYIRGGALWEAARVLTAARRFTEAGHILLAIIGYESADPKTLDAARRKTALKAAICFAHGGDTSRAIAMFLELGERGRAIEVLQKAGDAVGAAKLAASDAAGPSGDGPRTPAAGSRAPAGVPQSGADRSGRWPAGPGGSRPGADLGATLEAAGKLEAALDAYVAARQLPAAASIARRLKRSGEAARLYADADMPFEAASCFLEVGDKRRCLDQLVRIPIESSRYRTAAAHAARLAFELDVLDFTVEHFVGRFISSEPRSDQEVEGFYLLGRLYQAKNLPAAAREVFKKVAQSRPGHRDVRERLLAFEEAAPIEVVVEADPEPGFDTELPGDRTPVPLMLPPLVTPPSIARPGAAGGESPDVVAAGTSSAAAAAVMAVAPRGDAGVALREGAIVSGRYHLGPMLGRGGMATVYKATDLELGGAYAIKFFDAGITDDAMLSRFKAEVTLSRELRHPNVIKLYDLGSNGDGRYITMQLLEGRNLDALIGGSPLPLDRGLDYLAQACAALQAVHDRDIVHRDVKPDNFFLTDKGVLKILDFGIAKRVSGTRRLTVAGMAAGTPEYMAPEQVNDFGNVTHLADIYALGCMAYQMFTGTVPFHHKELLPLLLMHIKQPPEPPRARNPAIPGDLEALILQLLAKKPADRVASCAAVIERIEGMRKGG